MKLKRISYFPILAFMAWQLVFAKATAAAFANLDFESANIQQTQPIGYVDVTNALPHWNVYLGANQQSQVIFNTIAIGSTSISLLGTNGFGGSSIQGSFSVFLQGGLSAAEASISQSGLVPSLTQAVLFKAMPGDGAFLVSINGQSIPFYTLATMQNYTLFGGDISAFAGQTAELRFSALNVSGPNNWNLDSIAFSPTPVPEPETYALILIGAILSALHRLKERGLSESNRNRAGAP